MRFLFERFLMYFSFLFVWCEAKFVGLFLRSFRFFVFFLGFRVVI